MPPHRPDASPGQGTKRSSGTSLGRSRANMANSRRSKKELLAQSGEQEFYLDCQTTDHPQAGHRESVESLVRRLGTPPQDLVDYLSSQFAVLCRTKASSGAPLHQVDLADLAIDGQGKLLFTGNDSRDEIGETRQGAPETGELIDQFRERLTAPRPTRAPRDDRSEVQPGPTSLVERFERPADDESTTSSLSPDEQDQREQLIAKFTTALADRFGPEVLADLEACEDQQSRAVKLQPLERDRRFNWNLVLGVGTAAAVLALIWTGFQVNKIRHQRAESLAGPSAQTVSDTNTQTVSARPAQTVADSTPADIAVPQAQKDTSEIKDPASSVQPKQDFKTISLSPDSAFSDKETIDRFKVIPIDELINGLTTLPRADQSDVAAPEWDGVLDPETLPEGMLETDSSVPALDAYFPNANFDSKSSLRPNISVPVPLGDTLGETHQPGEQNESLKSVLDRDEPEDGEAPELPQQTRPAIDRFIELPSATETDTIIDEAGVAIRQIEFPFDAPLGLSKSAADGTLNLINLQDGNPMARLSTEGPTTRFTWVEGVAKEKSAEQLIHGRLIDEQGGSIYLRPSIETDPYGLSLNQRRRRPSWTIGAPILPDITRLKLELIAPDSLDVAWKEPFNATRPRRGTAIAILSPKDGETVGIAVKFDIDCSRKLTCRMQYAGRLGPNMPWQLMTEQGFRSQAILIQTNRENLAMRHQQFQRLYDEAGLTDRRLLKQNKEEIEKEQEQLELIAQRMNLLGGLILEMESKVTLSMHLYVQWPDSQQTILRTVSPNTAK